MKECSVCKQRKGIEEFSRLHSSRDGLQYSCKECKSKANLDSSRTKDGVITTIYKNQKHNSKRRCHVPPSYTKQELKEWVFSHDSFHILYERWVDSGYCVDLRPSVDRRDDDLPYSFSHRMDIMTFKDNREKYYSKQDKKPIHNRRTVYQYSKDGALMNTFASTKIAGLELGIGQNNVARYCRQERRSPHDFILTYKKDL